MTDDDVATTQRLFATTDASVWAAEWCRIAHEIEAAGDDRAVIDEGWMISWFANAIEIGRTAGRERGYDDGYQAAAADEQAVDARNRQRLDELRDDLLEHCRTWSAITEVTSRPSVIVSAGNDLQRAAVALAAHCAPRSET